MSEQQSIKETLSVIRKALEDDNDIDIKPSDEDILIISDVDEIPSRKKIDFILTNLLLIFSR